MNLRGVPQIGKTLQQIMVNFPSRRLLTDDKRMPNQVAPHQRGMWCQVMGGRKNRKELFGPQMLRLAAGVLPRACDEGNVDLMHSYCRDVFGWLAIVELNSDVFETRIVGVEKLVEEAG